MKKLSVRERILSASTRLFYSQGVLNTGINQIIKESNVAKASFYQYFPSKDNLIDSCIDEYCVTMQRIFNRIISKCESIKDFAIMWRRFLKKNVLKTELFMGCPIANIGFHIDPQKFDMTEKFIYIIDQWYLVFEELFKRAVTNGEIPKDTDFKNLFRSIVELNEGALIMWRLTGKDYYIDTLSDSILRIVETCE